MTCPENSPCIQWSVDGTTGSPSAFPVFSADVENDIACLDDASAHGPGLYAPKSLQVDVCAIFPPFSAIGALGVIGPITAETGTVKLTNPTTDRVMHCIVQCSFGATTLTCTALGSPYVYDYVKWGPEGTLAPFVFNERTGLFGVGISDGNITFPDSKTQVTIPGRSVPAVVCDDLPPGLSLEIHYQRQYGNGAGGTLADFLFQPTVIQAWGIVV